MFDTILSGCAAFLLLGFALYVLLRRRSPSDIALAAFLMLLALMEVSDRYLFQLGYEAAYLSKAPLLPVSLLPLAGVFFSLLHLRQDSLKSASPLWLALAFASLAFPASVFVFPVEDFYYSPDLQTDRMLFLGEAGYWFYIGIMSYCVIALMNLEATFTSTRGMDRWRVKFELIGAISIMAFLIFFFSQGLLYRTINLDLLPLRSGILIISVLMIGYSKLLRGNGVRVAMSRYILYRSLTLVLVGLYLLTLGIMGEGMKYFGLSSGRDLTLFAAFAAGIAMLVVLFSEKLRRKVRLFVGEHFYARKHDYRAEWLKLTGRLASCASFQEVQRAILSTYAETFGFSGAALYLRDGDRYACQAVQEMPGLGASVELSPGLASYFMEKKRVLNLSDNECRLAPEESRMVQETGADLIVPLRETSRLGGFVLLGRQVAKEELIFEDYELMKTFAEQATLSIGNFRLSEELAEMRELAAVARISSFVIHDLKNLTSSLSLLLENAGDFMHEPEFQKDMVSSVRSTVSKMKALMQRLKSVPDKGQLDMAPTDIGLLARGTVADFMKARPSARIACRGESAVSMADGEEIGKVILNMVLNAVEASGELGEVAVETGSSGDTAFIEVRDNGSGIREEFLATSLFKPFRTTKEKGLGIGLYQCKQIVEAHGGRIEAVSRLGKGSVFTVRLPLAGEAKLAS